MDDNIIGKVFGDMKVIKYVGTTKNYIKIYEVQCIKCKHIKNIQYSRLNSLETCYHSNKGCGIYLKEYDSNIGKTIGDYTIIKLDKITKHGCRYIVKCNICGNEYSMLLSNFNKGIETFHKNCSYHIPNDKYIKRFKKIYSGMIYRTQDIKNQYYGQKHI